jgi:hypothetical protein
MKKNKLYTLVLLPIIIGLVFYGFITSLGPNDQTTVNGYLTNGGLVFSNNSVVNVPPQRDNINYTATWSAGTNMPTPTRYHGAGAMWTNSTKDTSKLVCIGGDIDGSGNTSALVNIYNLTTNAWTAAPNVSASRFYPSACRAGDSIYFFGGIGGTGGAFTSEVNTVDVYNIRTNTMTLGPVLPTTYADQRTITYQDSIIYVVGGLTGGTANATANVYLFNRQTATYRTATALPVARSSFAGVIVGDTIYVVCGGTAYGTGSNTMYYGVISQSNRATITWTAGTNYPGTSTQRIYAEKWGCKGFIMGCGSAAGFTTSTECYVYLTSTHAWSLQTPATTPTSAYFSGSAPVGNSGITKWVVASGLILSPPYSIPNVQIFTDSLCGSGSTYGPPELLYYKIEDNPSQVLTPNCASAPVGTNPAPVGGVTIGSGGQFDSCLIGTGNTGTNGINTGWNCNLAGNSWTISFWVSNLAEVVAGNPTYLFGDPGSTTFRCFYAGFALPNNAIVRGPMPDLIFACPMPGSYTFHIVYNGTSVTIYRNGTLLTSENTTFSMPTGTGFRVAGYTGGAYSLNTGGKLDEFRLYNRALTAAEIAATWNQDLACGLVGIKQVNNQIPSSYSLSQNYPNPFNPTTTIKFEIPKAGDVEMKVYDALGKEVGTIVNEFKQAGSYSVTFNGDKIASGVYFYKLTVGDFTATKKMLLVK